MQIISTCDEARAWTRSLQAWQKTVGLVPTMGALHRGHLSLVEMCLDTCDETIVSIFVNPTQFGPGEDLDQYPRTLDEDLEALRAAGVSAAFVPVTSEMYPSGFSTYVDPPEVARSLEGICRPDHFRGVATVVLKLFTAIPADKGFFGKKDYQQLRVIETFVRDLNVGIEIVAGETVREPDGLALSSRNRYLSEADRVRALLLSAALSAAQQEFDRGVRCADTLAAVMRSTLLGVNRSDEHSSKDGVDKIDYAAVVDAQTLSPLDSIDQPAVALIAAHVAGTRLIDNRILG